VKLVVSVPEQLLQRVERVRKELGRSRSSVVAEALAFWLGHSDDERRARLYQEGYLRDPYTREEIAAVDRAADAVLCKLPWKESSRRR
jgi:metal-responsive CopG/Arc/MetJ family transcriptional regulator